jgi:hypothetical protein
VFTILLLFTATLAAAQESALPAISSETLASVDRTIAAARAEAQRLNIETLKIQYADGKVIEQYQDLILRQLDVAAENTLRLKSVRSLTLATVVSQTLAGVKETARDLATTLAQAGENASSAAAVRAAIPFVQMYKSFAQPSATFDTELLTMTQAADAALVKATRKSAG